MNRSIILLIKKNCPLLSHNSNINKMSWVTFISVIVGTISIICTIAIINGTSSLVKRTLTTFDSDIKVYSKQKKYFNDTGINIDAIKKIQHITQVNKILDEVAYLSYNGNSCIVNILGVEDYNKKLLNKTVGETTLSGPKAVLGLGVNYKLYGNILDPISIKIPKRNLKTVLCGNKIYTSGYIVPVGIFSVEQRFDDNVVITSLKHLQKITKNKCKISAIEISIDTDTNIDIVKNDIYKFLDKDYSVLTKTEKQKFLTKALNIEKILTTVSLFIIAIIALMNLLFILSMVIMYKEHDIAILKMLGETKIFTLFFSIGTLLGFAGTIIGSMISFVIIFLQQQFGFIKVGIDSALEKSYPMHISLYEYLFVICFLTMISCLLSIYPARKASKIY